MSDSPVLTPFRPLAEFISTLGEQPSQDSLHVYLNRLKEHGFNPSATIKKALSCGARIVKEVCELTFSCSLKQSWQRDCIERPLKHRPNSRLAELITTAGFWAETHPVHVSGRV